MGGFADTARKVLRKVDGELGELTFSGLPFTIPARNESADTLRRRRFIRRRYMQRWPLPCRFVAAAVMSISWPLNAFVVTHRLLRSRELEYSTDARWMGWHPVLNVWRYAIRLNLLPSEVLDFGLRNVEATSGDHWLSNIDTPRALRSLCSGEAAPIVDNKVNFAKFCAEIEMRHIPTLADWLDGKGSAEFSPVFNDPEGRICGLVLKPSSGSNAVGVELWERTGCNYGCGGIILTLPELLERGRNLSATGIGYLLQPRLGPHPEIGGFENGSPTARIITGRWPDGRVQALVAAWYQPVQGDFASNAAGWLDGRWHEWPINLLSGRIEERRGEVPCRAVSGSDLEGKLLPNWDEAIEMTTRAHAAMPGRTPALGWDILFSEKAPVLVEANLSVEVASMQIAHSKPMGQGALGNLIDAYIYET